MKPSIPRGTRDFGAAEMQKRQYIFNIIKTNFQLFGYAPIETPTMENSSTLLGKYGEEGDKLIFKIINNGNPFTEFGQKDIDFLSKKIKKEGEEIIDDAHNVRMDLKTHAKRASDLISKFSFLNKKTKRKINS